jgi:hypothetical protein
MTIIAAIAHASRGRKKTFASFSLGHHCDTNAASIEIVQLSAISFPRHGTRRASQARMVASRDDAIRNVLESGRRV